MRISIGIVLVFLAGWLAAGRLQPQQVFASGGPPDFADVIELADRCVVRVSTRSTRERRNASRDDGVGGGFVLRADGLIVTSRHVVAGAQRILVTVPGHGTVDARVVGQDRATDTALLKVGLSGLSAMRLGSSRELRVGQWALAAGSPYELPNSWSVGIVSGLHRAGVGVGAGAYQDYIQTDAAANLGNSGGPLCNTRGQVVGVMTAILSRTGGHQGVALAVPIEAVQAAAQRMLGGATERRPTMGVRVRAVSGSVGGATGLQITGFDPGSSAAAAGLVVGDRILVADGRPLRRAADLQDVVWRRRVGELVKLLVLRGTRRFETSVRLR